jgi:1-acyl-sn-glycerol-3-phosphate acyltransferase
MRELGLYAAHLVLTEERGLWSKGGVSLPLVNQFLDPVYPFVKLVTNAALSPPNELNGLSLEDRSPQAIDQWLPLLNPIYHHYFRVQTDGWQSIPEGQVLLIGSHNGGLATPDTLMMAYDWFRCFGTERPVHALMEPRVWQAMPVLAHLAAQAGALQANPHVTIQALNKGASLLIYPGGAKDVFRPFSQRHRICFHGQQAFVKLALEWHLPIVPLISYGAHSTLIVIAEIHDQLDAIAGGRFPWPFGFDPGIFPIYLGLPWGLSIGPLPNIPLPIKLHTRVLPPIWFDRYGSDVAHDRAYVDGCYKTVKRIMQEALDALVAEHAADVLSISE